MYAWICAYDYVCICIYVCLCICMHIHLYTHACGCTYALVQAHFVYLYSPISLLHARVLQVFLNTCMRVWGGIGSGVCFSLLMVSACYWRGRLCFGRGRDRGFVLYISLFLRVLGWWVCVCLYTRVHTHKTTLVLDASPGVRRTPGEPEEPRSTKAHYTCRPYGCTQYICLCICCAAGFDDLG